MTRTLKATAAEVMAAQLYIKMHDRDGIGEITPAIRAIANATRQRREQGEPETFLVVRDDSAAAGS